LDTNDLKNTNPDVASAETGKPLPLKARLKGVFTALVLIGLGVAMFIWHDLPLDPDNLHRARTRFFVTVLNWIWSRPTGVISSLLGLLVFYGALTNKSNDENTESASKNDP
jgi:hypothetical protein